MGVTLEPDNNNCVAITGIKKKYRSWVDKIWKGNLTKNEESLALNYTILKMPAYPLPVLTLTEVDCKKIIASILQTALDFIVICKEFPISVIHRLIYMQVLGDTNLYTELVVQ